MVGRNLGVGDHPKEDVHSCLDVAFCGLGGGVVVPFLKGSLLGDNQSGEEKVVAQRGGVVESPPA